MIREKSFKAKIATFDVERTYKGELTVSMHLQFIVESIVQVRGLEEGEKVYRVTFEEVADDADKVTNDGH